MPAIGTLRLLELVALVALVIALTITFAPIAARHLARPVSRPRSAILTDVRILAARQAAWWDDINARLDASGVPQCKSAAVTNNQGQASNPQTSQPQPTIAFDQAAQRGEEPGPVFGPFTIGAAQQQFGPTPLPATGYLRFLKIEVGTSTAGTGGTALNDYPFSLLALIRLQDTNGAPIYELTGYNAFLAMTYGGYAGSPDPRVQPDYSATTTSPRFVLRIPIEIFPDGTGSLANLSASAAYRLTGIVDTLANNYSVSPSPAPAITINTFCEFWTVPAPADMLGRKQAQSPAFSGAIQLWTQQPSIAVAAGQNVTTVNRTGNMLRCVIWVARTSAPVRAETPFPDPYTLKYDDRDLIISARTQRRMEMREFIPDLTARDTGVYVFFYNYGRTRFSGGSAGSGSDAGFTSWLPTVTSTRYQLIGASTNAGTLDLLINDISVSPQQPGVRATTGGLGFHPPVAGSPAGAL